MKCKDQDIIFSENSGSFKNFSLLINNYREHKEIKPSYTTGGSNTDLATGGQLLSVH